jgi:hypothetical protein
LASRLQQYSKTGFVTGGGVSAIGLACVLLYKDYAKASLKGIRVWMGVVKFKFNIQMRNTEISRKMPGVEQILFEIVSLDEVPGEIVLLYD